MSPEWLRYYIAAKLNDRVEDLEFNPDDFVARVNSDLVGKYVNIASRAAPFLLRSFDGKVLPAAPGKPAWWLASTDDAAAEIRTAINDRQYGRAVRKIMELADQINRYFDEKQPWALAKDPAKRDELHRVVSDCIVGFKNLTRVPGTHPARDDACGGRLPGLRAGARRGAICTSTRRASASTST